MRPAGPRFRGAPNLGNVRADTQATRQCRRLRPGAPQDHHHPVVTGAAGTFDAYGPRSAHRWIGEEPDRLHRQIDATLGFFDVVGYTRLSERLARAGAAGAEAVTETMDRIFAALIEPALAAGGDVLQFSGDALLILFDGADHAARACVAAREMQRVMADVGSVDTLAGRARLRMSAGLHSGSVDLVLLGAAQRVLLAVGPAATECLRAEQAGAAGEVLVTAATAAAIPDGWCRGARDGRSLLGRVPRPVDGGTPGADADLARPAPPVAALAVPEPLRDALAAGLAGEHRQVTLAFVGVRGVDAAIARDGAPAVARRLQRLALAAEQAQAEFGVTWIGADALAGGADLVLIAGAPTVAEDDEDRIVRASRLVLDGADGLEVAVGVNRGRNFVGPIGHPTRRTVCITGDATNLAARIMAHASPGQLLVSEPLLRRLRGRVRVQAVEPFTAKGKRAPVRAVDLLAIGPQAGAAVVPDDVPLIGRDAELDALREMLATRGPAAGRVVEIVAPPGMGKSRLVEALRATATGTWWWWGGGEAYARSRPYLPLRAPLRAAFGIPVDADPASAATGLQAWVRRVAPDLERWLAFLAAVVDADIPLPPSLAALEPEARRDRLHRTVVAALEATLAPHEALLLDDLHWFDDASRQLVEAIAAAAGPAGWFLLLTRRPGEPLLDAEAVEAVPWHTTFELAPLDPAAARALTIAAAGAMALGDADIARVGARAGGNPLFLRELVAAVATTDAPGELPETVERVIAARLDALEPRRRLRVREAAVLGRTVDLGLLAGIADDPTLAEPATWRLDGEFVEVLDDATLRFRHDLFRDAAYVGLSLRRRTSLHARAAAALADSAGDDLAGVVALHATEGRMWSLAWEWSGRAARDAQAKSAFADALDARARALVAARHLPDLPASEVAAAQEALAETAYPLARFDLADRAFARAGRICADDPIVVARSRRRRGDIAVLEGRIMQGKRWYTLSLRALDGVGGAAAAFERVRARLGTTAALHSENDNRAAIATGRVALAEAEAAGDSDAVAEALMLLATSTAILGEAGGGEFGTRALAVMRGTGDDARLANTLLNLGVAEHNANRLVAALDHYARAQGAFDRIGDVVGSALVTHNRGEVLADLGRVDDAREACTDSLRQFRACGAPLGAALSQSALGRLAVFDGDPEGGLASLEAALEAFERAGHSWYAADTRARIAECHVIFGSVDAGAAALASAERAAATVDPPGILPTWLARLRGLLAWRSGDRAGAESVLSDALLLADEADQPVEAARALACLVGTHAGRVTERDELSARVATLGLVRVTAIPPPDWP